MNAIKLLSISGFALLTACVPQSQVYNEPMPMAPQTTKAQRFSQQALPNETTKTTKPTLAKTNKNEITEINKSETVLLQKGKTTKESVEISAKDNKKPKVTNSSGARISSFEISGALAARNKNKGWSASLNWVQRGASAYQIRLSGPLGSGTVLISKSGGLVTLKDGPKVASSSNAGTLLKQQTGISLPVNSLYYWVRGIPAPGGVQSEKHDDAGRLLMLRQNGFIVAYLQYTAYGNKILPSHIRLQGNGVFIKLIVKRWRI